METKDLIAIVGLVIFAGVVGYFAAREGDSREEVHGGSLSKLLHYLASALMISVAPTVLVMALIIHPETTTIAGITVVPFIQVLGIAFGMMALAYLLLLPHAALEKPQLTRIAAQKDEGWTEADARSSGL